MPQHDQFSLCPLAQNLRKTLQKYEMKGMLKVYKKDKKLQHDTFIDLKNVWHSNTQAQEKQYEAIRSSELFSDDRSMTFLKFNYRNNQIKSLSYEAVFNKIVKKEKKKPEQKNKHFAKGTMHVSQLWSQNRLKQVLGNLPFPRDRLKVLKMYPTQRAKLFTRGQSGELPIIQ